MHIFVFFCCIPANRLLACLKFWVSPLDILQWNLVNTDTKGTCRSVCINWVSALSRLSEKNVMDICSIDVKVEEDEKIFLNFFTIHPKETL